MVGSSALALHWPSWIHPCGLMRLNAVAPGADLLNVIAKGGDGARHLPCHAPTLPQYSLIKISCYWNIGILWSYPVMDVALGSWALTWGQSEDLGWISGLFLNGEPCNSRLSYAAAGAWPNHSVSWRLCTPPLPGPPASSPVIPLPQLVQVLTFHRQTH